MTKQGSAGTGTAWKVAGFGRRVPYPDWFPPLMGEYPDLSERRNPCLLHAPRWQGAFADDLGRQLRARQGAYAP